MPLIAITGGVAAGKSTFTRLLGAALPAAIFDTDQSARLLVNEDADVAHAVRVAFGDGVFDLAGRIDRAALRQLVFASRKKRAALEAILHPRVRALWTQWAHDELQKARNAILLVEIPLLYETAAASLFDQIIIVGCARESQLGRLTTERGLSNEIAHQIIASQWPLSDKIHLGDRLIWNDGTRAGLQMQVDFCARYYQELYPPPSAAT